MSDVIGMSDRSSASESRCLRNSVDAPSAGKASMSLESESKKAHIYKKKAIFRLSPVDSRVLFFSILVSPLHSTVSPPRLPRFG